MFSSSVGMQTAVLMISALAAGCASSDREERQWTEEVLLEDGSKVQIERYVAFDESNAMGGGAYNAVEAKATLTIKDGSASLPAWDFPRAALVLYRSAQSGHWIVVSTTSSCEVWRKGGQPRPLYWQHELVEGNWNQVPLGPESLGKRTNLFYSYWKDDFPKRITPELTIGRQSDPKIVKRYREVVRDDENQKYCM